MNEFDWQTISQAFSLGAFPWISQLKKLKIHLDLKNYDSRTINNFFASLFAMSVFIFFNYSHPYQIIHFPTWWIFIIVAFFLSIIYISIFIFFRDRDKDKKYRIVLIISIVVYILIFSSLTAGFGILKVYSRYYVFNGVVIDKNTDKGYPYANIVIENEENDQIVAEIQTNRKGQFKLLVNNPNHEDGIGIKVDDCQSLTVISDEYQDETAELNGDFSIITTIKYITIGEPR
ncbi:MAG: hypothetical protein ABJO02_20050 [Reichenbachiella sp.]|uniref:hypothetical protein n=1 Tax=Reichenbachiella sp. TaxID=2184521 RepID=UPI003296C858